MINITNVGNSVQIVDGEKTLLFPKGTLTAIAHSGDYQSVDLRLIGSRKNVMSFRYDNCNLAEDDAEETVLALSEVL